MKGQRRTLTWYIGGVLTTTNAPLNTKLGPAFIAEADLWPRLCRMHVEAASRDAPITVGIFADGVSIFSQNPSITAGTTVSKNSSLNSNRITAGQIMTMQIISVGSSVTGSGLTVQLELEEA